MRVLKYLTNTINVSEEEKIKWYNNWIHQGFMGLETFLQKSQKYGNFCLGDKPTLADICLVPQVYNANRWKCNLDQYPIVQEINANCLKLEAFKNAVPE